jgi:outer membrane protein W
MGRFGSYICRDLLLGQPIFILSRPPIPSIMRKTLYAVALLLSVTVVTNASAQLRIGVRAGANIASQARDIDTTTLSSKVGFIGGLDAQYWFNTNLGLNLQLLYAQKGVSEGEVSIPNPVTHTQATVSRDMSLNYLEIPLLLRYNLSDGKYRPYVFAGPSFGLFMSGKQTTTSTGENVASNLNGESDIPSANMGSDLSLNFGAGISYKMTYGPAFTLDAGYAMGMSKITKAGVDDAANIRSKDIRIMLGINFQMGDSRDMW